MALTLNNAPAANDITAHKKPTSALRTIGSAFSSRCSVSEIKMCRYKRAYERHGLRFLAKILSDLGPWSSVKEMEAPEQRLEFQPDKTSTITSRSSGNRSYRICPGEYLLLLLWKSHRKLSGLLKLDIDQINNVQCHPCRRLWRPQ